MRILIAGGGGAVGRRLVPMLVAAGHDVVATTRSPNRLDDLRALGAQPAIADGLDRERMLEVVAQAAPDVIVHQMTALAAASTNLRRFDRDFAATNELRTRGTEHLLEAARAAGVTRLVAQSFTGWPNARDGAAVKTEQDPLDADPPAAQRESLAAIRTLERLVLQAPGIDGLALRYGLLYGPGTGIEHGGPLLEAVARRRFPIVGDGAGVWSFVHVDDAAAATVAAIERGRAGAYNVVDDDPAPASSWLPQLARTIGAPPPRRVPVWLGRLAGGEVAVSMMTRIRGSSNAKARRELRWRPRHGSWRDGFRHGLGGGALDPLRDAGTILLTTYRRDGTPVPTPVSVAFDGSHAYFRSYDRAYKTKRLRNDPRVEAAPSTLRGKPKGAALPARARLLSDGDAERAARALARRHRVLQALLVPLAHRMLHYRTMHYELYGR